MIRKHSLSQKAGLVAVLMPMILVFSPPPAYSGNPPPTAPARHGSVHDVERGDPERKAILDAVRAANADLNDRVPIVFLVERLRSDGRVAYFRGGVRRKTDGLPLDRRTWGECEQEPDTAILEALLVKRSGRWQAIKANRCADDVFPDEEERVSYAALIGDDPAR